MQEQVVLATSSLGGPASTPSASGSHRRGPGSRFAPSGSAAVLKSLAAAGVTGTKRRAVPEIEAELKVAEEVVRRLKRERKSVINANALSRSKRSPEFIAKWKAGINAAWADPEKSAARREAARELALRQPRALPPMTAAQRTLYEAAKKRGLSRDEALSAARGA